MAELNPNIDQSKITILIVDDIPLNVLLIQKMLGKFHYKLLIANDGKAALDTISREEVDLVLLDLMMPVMDGYEVLEHLRANDATKELPVVILSALNSNDDVKRGFDLGANDFITKPIIMDKLLDSIAKQVNAIWEKKTQR
jgi:CheY-like chemotaxis protein